MTGIKPSAPEQPPRPATRKISGGVIQSPRDSRYVFALERGADAVNGGLAGVGFGPAAALSLLVSHQGRGVSLVAGDQGTGDRSAASGISPPAGEFF